MVARARTGRPRRRTARSTAPGTGGTRARATSASTRRPYGPGARRAARVVVAELSRTGRAWRPTARHRSLATGARWRATRPRVAADARQQPRDHAMRNHATMIRGDRVTLRPIAPGDRAPLKAIRDEPEVIRFWGEQTAEWPGDDGTVEEWVVELDGEIAGFVQFFEEPDADYRHADVDILLATRFHGQGLGTDAMRAIMRPPDRAARPPPDHAHDLAAQRPRDPRLREARLPPGRDHAPERARRRRPLARRAADGVRRRARD